MDILLITALMVLFGAINVTKGHLSTPSISYLEPVHYDVTSLQHQHRSRRSTSDFVNLRFRAFTREWSITLVPYNKLFSNDVIMENSNGPISFDLTSAYAGKVIGEKSEVFGTITTSGHFEGQINLVNDSYILEKATKHNITSNVFHTVMYNIKDVNGLMRPSFCGQAGKPQRRISEKAISPEAETDLMDFKLRYSSDEERLKRHKRAVDPNKIICELYIQVDHLLFFKFNNVTDDVIGHINNHVMSLNSIYNGVDFDGDTSPDNIGFSIKRIKIYDDPTATNYKYAGNYGVSSMLYLHSEENYDDFCLSYIFTYRDFDNGILGLAWTADPSPNVGGGLCSKYAQYTDGWLGLNTGIVTFLNYGNDVTTAVSYVTFAHEIGHNFGSEHDPSSDSTCSPGGTEGNFIMFAQATSGTKPNNVKLSSCSISQMAPLIENKGRDSVDGCFVAFTGSTCGNKVVETGEDCDCGWDGECTDPCCYPSLEAGGPDADKACQFKPGVTCSPSQGVCCNPSTCAPYVSGDNYICRANSSCLDKAVCHGALECPDSTSAANGTVCDTEKVCFLGQCSSQVCEAHGFEPCQCAPTTAGNWKDPLLCTLCCQDPGDSTCKPADQISGISVPFTNAVPGTPCNNFLGYCDVFHICREVDPSGPLSSLKNFLLNGELINKIKDFLTEHWYVAIAGGVAIIILLILIIKCCSKSSKGKVQPEPRRISVGQSKPVHTRY